MNLSTKGRYGVRAMFDLALHQGDGPISLRNIADRQGVSEKYLEQLIGALRKEGLVNSVRGAHGGYLLAKEPAEITIGDIIRALEGPVTLADCVGADLEECEYESDCVVKLVWQQIKDKIDGVLDSVTLEDLQQEAINAQQKEKQPGYMYHI